MATAVAMQRRQRPGGRELAQLASRGSQTRSRVREITNWAEFQAASAELRDSNASRGAQLWQAIGLSMARTDLVAKDLRARIEALEAEIAGKTTAKAPVAKPLRMKLMREINDATVQPIIDAIEGARGREIKLSIMSPGGGVYPARRLADAIADHGAVDTNATIECDSAATLVWAAGRRRSALQNCTFLFHRPSLSGRDAQTPGEARRIDKVAKDMAAFLAARTTGTKPAAFLKLMTKAGNIIDPGQASMLGLLNDTVRRPHEPKKRKAR